MLKRIVFGDFFANFRLKLWSNWD